MLEAAEELGEVAVSMWGMIDAAAVVVVVVVALAAGEATRDSLFVCFVRSSLCYPGGVFVCLFVSCGWRWTH